MYVLIVILVSVLALAFSWGTVSGAFWLICKLVGWTFSWETATAIWIGLTAVRILFDKGSASKS